MHGLNSQRQRTLPCELTYGCTSSLHTNCGASCHLPVAVLLQLVNAACGFNQVTCGQRGCFGLILDWLGSEMQPLPLVLLLSMNGVLVNLDACKLNGDCMGAGRGTTVLKQSKILAHSVSRDDK
jgi:hypothetical protein